MIVKDFKGVFLDASIEDKQKMSFGEEVENAIIKDDGIYPMPYPSPYAKIVTPNNDIPAQEVKTIVRLENVFVGFYEHIHWCYETYANSILFVQDGVICRLTLNDVLSGVGITYPYISPPCSPLSLSSTGEIFNSCCDSNDRLTRTFTFTYYNDCGQDSMLAPLSTIDTPQNKAIAICDKNIPPSNAAGRRFYEVFIDDKGGKNIFLIGEQELGHNIFIANHDTLNSNILYDYNIDEIIPLPIIPKGITNFGNSAFLVWNDHEVYFSMPRNINVYDMLNILTLPKKIYFCSSIFKVEEKRGSLFSSSKNDNYYLAVIVCDETSYTVKSIEKSISLKEYFYSDAPYSEFSYGNISGTVCFLGNKDAFIFYPIIASFSPVNVTSTMLDFKKYDLSNSAIYGAKGNLFISLNSAKKGNHLIEIYNVFSPLQATLDQQKIESSPKFYITHSFCAKLLTANKKDEILITEDCKTLLSFEDKGVYNSFTWKSFTYGAAPKFLKSISVNSELGRKENCSNLGACVTLFDIDYPFCTLKIKDRKKKLLPRNRIIDLKLEINSNIPIHSLEIV
ncbi:MAG: hypothetical protein [Caudoviricetes sp.]|nr:MAG: hypothetical protein [Caudoviricetes sp.]